MAGELKELSCKEVGENIPESMRQRVEEEFAKRATKTVAVCDFVAQGTTVEEVLKRVSDHAAAEHGMKSWPPELWVHMRMRVHDASA